MPIEDVVAVLERQGWDTREARAPQQWGAVYRDPRGVGTLIPVDELAAAAVREGWAESEARRIAEQVPAYEVGNVGPGLGGVYMGPDVAPEYPNIQVSGRLRDKGRDQMIAHELLHAALRHYGPNPEDLGAQGRDVRTLAGQGREYPVAAPAATRALGADSYHVLHRLRDELGGDMRRLPRSLADQYFWMMRDKEQAGKAPYRVLIPAVTR